MYTYRVSPRVGDPESVVPLLQPTQEMWCLSIYSAFDIYIYLYLYLYLSIYLSPVNPIRRALYSFTNLSRKGSVHLFVQLSLSLSLSISNSIYLFIYLGLIRSGGRCTARSNLRRKKDGVHLFI